MNPEKFPGLPEEAMPKDYYSSAYYDLMGVPINMDLLTLNNKKLPTYLRVIALERLSEFVDLVYQDVTELQQ